MHSSLFEVHLGGSHSIRSVMQRTLYLKSDQNVWNAVRMLLRIFGLQLEYTLIVTQSLHHLKCSQIILNMCKLFGTAWRIDTNTVKCHYNTNASLTRSTLGSQTAHTYPHDHPGVAQPVWSATAAMTPLCSHTNGIKQRYPTCWLCQYSRFMIDLRSTPWLFISGALRMPSAGQYGCYTPGCWKQSQ